LPAQVGKVAERGDALSQRDGNGTEMGEIVCFDSNCLLHFLAVTLDLYFPIIYLLALLVFFLCMSFLHGVFCHHSTSAIELTSQDVELNQFKIEKDRFYSVTVRRFHDERCSAL